MKKILLKNKKAKFDYELETFYEAGIKLTGPEVKSLKLGKGSIKESFISITNKGIPLWKQGHIAKFENGFKYILQEEMKDRPLLLNKREISSIIKEIEIKGKTLIPIDIYINAQGYLKMTIAIGKGKNKRDKRNSLKERESNISIQRSLGEKY